MIRTGISNELSGLRWLSIKPIDCKLMPDLFSPYTLKGVTLRNRIAMSPMTMHRAVDGKMDDYHVMLMGSRAASGFGLVFAEQIAITPDGRTGTSCAGIWDDSQIEGLARMCHMLKAMGGLPTCHSAGPHRTQGQ
jgi:2,4-dienoyl-CoA reductase-like NADH-dependent reductase (Old Yellow Enzyme family)